MYAATPREVVALIYAEMSNQCTCKVLSIIYELRPRLPIAATTPDNNEKRLCGFN